MGSEVQLNASPVVSLSSVRVSLGGRIIQDEMTFTIQGGEYIAALGPNGAGKSTLLELLLGLVRPESGRVEVMGESLWKRNNHIGYVPQFRMIESDLTLRGREVVRFGFDGNKWGPGWPSRARRDRIDQILQGVDAIELAELPIGQLSGGERQRLLIAQALLTDPRLLLLDEPLANLDISREGEIIALGLGVLFLSIYTRSSASHANAGVSVLSGSILSVQPADIYRLLKCGSAALAALAVVYRPLLFASIDPTSARARGVPVRALSVVFLLAPAAACTFVVGVLLACGLLIAPAAATARMTHRPPHSLLLSLGFGIFITWAGLLVSFIGPWRHPPICFSISANRRPGVRAGVILGRRGHPRVVKAVVELDREVRSIGGMP